MLKSFLSKWSFLSKLPLFLGLILLFLIVCLIYFKIVPLGHITYSRSWPTSWKLGQGFISNLKPDNRLDFSNPRVPKIIGQPIYFTVFTPRRFNTAIMTVQYRSELSSSTPIIELGLLKDQLTEAYNLQPLENDILAHWRSKWFQLPASNSLLILQAHKNYSSSLQFLSDLSSGFLKDCPRGPINCVAVYNYSTKINYSLPNNVLLRPLTITQPLRGAHQFYLYLRDKPWYLDLEFAYLRQDSKPDPITVNIWFNHQIVWTKTILDTNFKTPRTGKLETKSLHFSALSQPAGVYKVEIKISPDVVIKKIESSSNKLAIIHKIWPVSGTGNLNLFTDAKHLRVQSSNPASLGKIIFGGRSFNFNKTYQAFNYLSPLNDSRIKLKKDDIILEDNGVFSFSPSSLFNPGLKQVDRYFSPGRQVKYIIARYRAPQEKSGLKTATAQFNLVGAPRVAGHYTFVISIPGLSNKKGVLKYLEIKKINVSLQGKTLWQRLRF